MTACKEAPREKECKLRCTLFTLNVVSTVYIAMNLKTNPNCTLYT